MHTDSCQLISKGVKFIAGNQQTALPVDGEFYIGGLYNRITTARPLPIAPMSNPALGNTNINGRQIIRYFLVNTITFCNKILVQPKPVSILNFYTPLLYYLFF